MKAYEGYFILPPDATEEVRKGQLLFLEDLIKKSKGRLTKKIETGTKALGYPIRKYKEGFIVVYHFEVCPGSISDMRRTLELSDHLLKYMITIKPEMEPTAGAPAPSTRDSQSSSLAVKAASN